MVAKSSLGDVPEQLRPYKFHRVEMSWTGTADAVGNCPFCNKERHLYVSQKTGQYDCKVCGARGNAYTFLRKLIEISSAPSGELDMVAEERRVSAATLRRWGLVRSPLDGEWMLPTYGLKGDKVQSEVNNIYRWSKVKDKRRLLTTATFSHSLFGLQFWDPNKPDVYLLEGPWDAMALEEALMKYRRVTVEGAAKLVRTVDVAQSLYARANVLATPGCGTFLDSWPQIFARKNVHLGYDNDYPKANGKTGKIVPPAGTEGMKAAAKRIRPVASSVRVLYWGEEGYDSTLPDGCDVRDFLNQAS